MRISGWSRKPRAPRSKALIVGVVGLVGCAAGFLLAGPMMQLLFGPSFLPAAAPFRILCVGLTLVFALWILGPIYFTVQSSFATPGEMTARPPHWIPEHFNLDNYAAVFGSATDKSGQYTSEQGGRMWSALLNSLLVGILVAFSNLLIGGLARIEGKAKLSQNRPGEERLRVIAALRAEGETSLADAMERVKT